MEVVLQFESIYFSCIKDSRHFLIFLDPPIKKPKAVVKEDLSLPVPVKTEIETLNEDMNAAAEKGEYDKAAELRDKINELKRKTT